MDSKSTITSIRWLPRAAMNSGNVEAAESARDQRKKLLEEQLQQNTQRDEGDAEDDATKSIEKEFNMDDYDEEVETDRFANLFVELDQDARLTKEKDPYMTGDDEVGSEAGSDGPDDYYTIKDSDLMFVAANAEDDACSLEVYLYDTKEGGMYVHHDLLLTSYPLCTAWLPKVAGSAKGSESFLAVGTFDQSIDIWDVSLMDCMEPTATLGVCKAEMKGKNKKRRNKKKNVTKNANGISPQTHTGPVMCLDVSRVAPTALASGSADETVKVWDLTTAQAVCTLEEAHNGKVQCVSWSLDQDSILASAAYDRTVTVSDIRAGKAVVKAALPKGSGDPEAMLWLRSNPSELLLSTELGHVLCFDSRKGSLDKPIWSMQAHDVACTSIADTAAAECGMLLTCGVDGYAKVWDMGTGIAAPKLVYQRNLGVGPLFQCQSSDDDPNYCVFAGQAPVLWDVTDTGLICSAFPNLPGAQDEDAGKSEVRRADRDEDDDDDAAAAAAAPLEGEEDIDMEEEG